MAGKVRSFWSLKSESAVPIILCLLCARSVIENKTMHFASETRIAKSGHMGDTPRIELYPLALNRRI